MIHDFLRKWRKLKNRALFYNLKGSRFIYSSFRNRGKNNRGLIIWQRNKKIKSL